MSRSERSTRSRTRTEKGKFYDSQLVQERRSHLGKKLEKLVEDL